MANAWYRKGAEKVLLAQVNFDTDTIKARLVKNTYAQNLSTDEFISSVTEITGSTDQTLANPSVTNGVFDADDITFTAVPAGETSEGVVIYKDTGVAGTSPLLMYIDTITGFPLATNGGNVVIQWDNGAYKIVSL
mgnify:CR=1 FL=1